MKGGSVGTNTRTDIEEGSLEMIRTSRLATSIARAADSWAHNRSSAALWSGVYAHALLRPSADLVQCQQQCGFHSSSLALAPKKDKGGKGKGEDTPVADLPKVKVYEQMMTNTTQWFTGELAKIKVGAVTVDTFANLPMSSSSYSTVGKAGQLVMKTSTKLVISLFDPSVASLVVAALENCGLNLRPTVDGSNVVANIPRPSRESRELLISNASKVAEKCKIDIRNHRKKGLDEAKKVKDGHSEDDYKRFTKELDSVTEKKVEMITNALKAKEKELLAGV